MRDLDLLHLAPIDGMWTEIAGNRRHTLVTSDSTVRRHPPHRRLTKRVRRKRIRILGRRATGYDSGRI